MIVKKIPTLFAREYANHRVVDMYYELTYNGDKKELYLDAYKKWENKCISVCEE